MGLLQKYVTGAVVEVKPLYYSAICIVTGTAIATVEMEVSDVQVTININTKLCIIEIILDFVNLQRAAIVMERCGLLEVQMKEKEELRSALEELGEPSMTHTGDHQMLLWSAGSLGIL